MLKTNPKRRLRPIHRDLAIPVHIPLAVARILGFIRAGTPLQLLNAHRVGDVRLAKHGHTDAVHALGVAARVRGLGFRPKVVQGFDAEVLHHRDVSLGGNLAEFAAAVDESLPDV